MKFHSGLDCSISLNKVSGQDMDIDDYISEALEFATKICTGEATALEKLLLRDLLKKCETILYHRAYESM